MRKILLLLSITMFCSSITAFGGDDEDDRRRRRRRKSGKGSITMEVATSPLGYIWGDFNVSGLAYFNEKVGGALHLSYRNFGLGEYKYTGFYAAPEARYYFSPKTKNDGFFAGAYLKYENTGTSGEAYATIDNNGDLVQYDKTVSQLDLGITYGYTWVTDFNMTFSIWAGTGYALVNNTKNSKEFEENNDPFMATFNDAVDKVSRLDYMGGLSIGYRF